MPQSIQDPEYDPNKPTMIRHERYDEPVRKQWMQSLRGEIHNSERPPFTLDFTDESKKARQPSKWSRTPEKINEEREAVASWQNSLRGGMQDTSWVDTPISNPKMKARNNRASSEQRSDVKHFR